MFEAFTYGYANARIRAMKSFLLDKNKLMEVASSKTLEEFIARLDDTVYGKGLREIKELDAGRIETFFLRGLTETNKKVVGIAPRHVKGFIEFYTRSGELSAVKAVINSKFGPVERLERYDVFVSPEIKRVWNEMLSAKTVEEVINLLPKRGYREVLKAVEKKDSFILNAVLDRYYFDTLWKKMGMLSGREGEIAKDFIGLEIDSVNLLNTMRACKLGIKLDEQLTVPVEHRVKLPAITNLNRVEDIVSAAGFYSKMLKDEMKEYEEAASLYVFEKALRRLLVEKSRAAFTGSPFHIGILLGFLKLKEVEINNLKGIALGIGNGLGESDIKDVLVV